MYYIYTCLPNATKSIPVRDASCVEYALHYIIIGVIQRFCQPIKDEILLRQVIYLIVNGTGHRLSFGGCDTYPNFFNFFSVLEGATLMRVRHLTEYFSQIL